MAKLIQTVLIINEGDAVFHIPGAPDQYETVCGWVDVEHE